MALLDLQAMENKGLETGGGGGHSSHSNNSCTASDVSLLLCGDHSVLSLTLCHN